MPFDAVAARRAGLSADAVSGTRGHFPISGEPPIAVWFSDILSVPSLHAVVSLGDLALVVGVTLFILGAATAPAHADRQDQVVPRQPLIEGDFVGVQSRLERR